LEACGRDRLNTIPDTDRLTHLVVECMYAVERWEDLPDVFSMGESLHAIASATGSHSSGFAPLGSRARKLATAAENDLRVAETCTELGSPLVPRAVAELREAATAGEEEEAVSELLTRICRLAVAR
jgi:hypothetical protein